MKFDKDLFEVKNIKNALIIGASSYIGTKITDLLLNKGVRVYATYFSENNLKSLLYFNKDFGQQICLEQVDVTNEESIVSLFAKLKSTNTKLDLIINCVGFLHNKNIKPEKSIKDIYQNYLNQYFLINSIPIALITKYAQSCISKTTPSAIVLLSAKLGSIDDNTIGGWYGYRASKAAANMFLRTLAIEFTRSKYNSFFCAVHPGTTKSPLSEPYIGSTNYEIHTPEQTAQNILNVIDKQTTRLPCKFISWNGQNIKW